MRWEHLMGEERAEVAARAVVSGGRPLAVLAGNPEAHRQALGMLGDQGAREAAA
jgi:hypothetical protein